MSEDEPQEFRPRYGRVLRADGRTELVFFRPTEEPDVFEPVSADTEKVVVLNAGDTISFDKLGAHQGIRVLRDDNHTEGRTRPGWGLKMDDEMKKAVDAEYSQPRHARNGGQSWSSVMKGLVTMAGLAGLVIGTVWAIHSILS